MAGPPIFSRAMTLAIVMLEGKLIVNWPERRTLALIGFCFRMVFLNGILDRSRRFAKRLADPAPDSGGHLLFIRNIYSARTGLDSAAGISDAGDSVFEVF